MAYRVVLLLAAMVLVCCSSPSSWGASQTNLHYSAHKQIPERAWPPRSASRARASAEREAAHKIKDPSTEGRRGEDGKPKPFGDVDKRMDAERRKLNSALTICRC